MNHPARNETCSTNITSRLYNATSNRINKWGNEMEISGIELSDGVGFGDEGVDYSIWVGEEKLSNGSILEVTAKPSNGQNCEYIENDNIEQILYSVMLFNADDDYVLDVGKHGVFAATSELNKEKAEWVIGVIRKLLVASKIQPKVLGTEWAIRRAAQPRRL